MKLENLCTSLYLQPQPSVSQKNAADSLGTLVIRLAKFTKRRNKPKEKRAILGFQVQ
jgi:hypothetical protein